MGKLEFCMYMNLSIFLVLKNPLLDFLNLLGSGAILPCKKTCIIK